MKQYLYGKDMDEFFENKKAIEKEIIKTYKKYCKIKNSKETFSSRLYQYGLPGILLGTLTIGLPLGIGALIGLLTAPALSVIMAATIGMSSAAVLMCGNLITFNKFNLYEKIFNKFDKEEMLEKKLKDLEYRLRNEADFTKEGTIFNVPVEKIEDYITGNFECERTYLMAFEDKKALLTMKDVEKLRSLGCETEGFLDSLHCKILTPDEVEKYKADGYQFVKYGQETLVIKDNKVVSDTNRTKFKPSYAHEMNPETKQQKISLIKRLLEKSNISPDLFDPE